jgi:transcriptional regulator with XRE-family HTH domain
LIGYYISKIVLEKDSMGVIMGETLYQLRVNLGWTQKKLSQQSGVNAVSITNAERGRRITATSAKKIADALSLAYGREIKPLDIEGLNIE